MTERLAHYSVAPQEDPIRELPGESLYAIRAPKMHTGRDRIPKWYGKEFGLVVHTCGSALPERAHRAGIYPTIIAADWYFKQHGPHYVCGWKGYEGGDLLQVANERQRSNGVGTGDQRAAEKKGWEKSLRSSIVKRWKARWPGHKRPLKLLPAAPNTCMIQVEMIPCVFWVKGKKFIAAEPMRKGLKFTLEQHDTIAFLACDIARRLGWPDGWWETPRLLGHEDLSPISRTDKNGGWDPGGLRASPYFDWEYIYTSIEDILGK